MIHDDAHRSKKCAACGAQFRTLATGDGCVCAWFEKVMRWKDVDTRSAPAAQARSPSRDLRSIRA